MNAGTVSGALFALLLDRLFCWLPGSISVCVWAVFAVFFFIVFIKVIRFVFEFIFKFIDLIKP